MEINFKNILPKVSLYVSFLTFIVFAVYILFLNQDVFYTVHDRSEFLYGETFYDVMLRKPFGLMQYIGAWLTQLFYYPVLGSAVIVVLWTMIFFVGKKAFRLKSYSLALMLLPIACLLTSIVDLGYWVYLSQIRGYFFSHSVGYLVVLLLLWAARCTPRKWHIVWYIIGFCIYPVLGWLALLFILCLLLVEKPTWGELIGLVLLLITPLLWKVSIYSNLKVDDVIFAGLPRFITASDVTEKLSVPFWVLGSISVLIALFARYLSKWYVSVLCTIAGVVFTLSLMYYDSNYIDEMRMTRYAVDDNWKEALSVVEQVKKPTSAMVMLKNVALMNEGGLLDRSFAMGNEVNPLCNPDSVHVSFLEIAAPVTYYNYGMLNEGFRLSFECAVQSGFSPYYLKMLARCAHANGEDNLAQRYIAQLHHHPFYKDWQPAPTTKTIAELHNSYSDEITGVENSDGYIVTSISLWYDTDSKLASEQALLYSMIRRDSKRFWASFRKYIKLHMGEAFPNSVAEAYIMYMDKSPEEKRVMIPVSEDLLKRYKQFWATLEESLEAGKGRDETAELMRPDFGDTYWYYNIFSRRVY